MFPERKYDHDLSYLLLGRGRWKAERESAAYQAIITRLTHYIDYEDGNDWNTGTRAAPWKHCKGMAGCAAGSVADSYVPKARDRFNFKGGVTWPTTALPFNITVSGSGPLLGVITYSSDNSWYKGPVWSCPIFDGEDTAVDGWSLVVINASNITFEKIEIKNMRLPLIAEASLYMKFSLKLYGSFGLPYNTGITINDCYVHDWISHAAENHKCGGIGIQYAGGVVNECEIRGHEAAVDQRVGVGFYMAGDSAVTELGNCHIHNMPNGIVVAQYLESVHDCEIHHINKAIDTPITHENGMIVGIRDNGTAEFYNNEVYDTASGAPPVYIYPHKEESAVGVVAKAYNNIVYGMTDTTNGIIFDGRLTAHAYNNVLDECQLRLVKKDNSITFDGVYFKNNIFLNEGRINIDAGTVRHVEEYDYNLYDGSLPTIIVWEGAPETLAQIQVRGHELNGLVDNPLLGADYKSTIGTAPGVDSGVDMSAHFTIDHDNLVRPQGAAWDRGAYEYV